ncbi:Acyltransferase-like protein [Euroglyphus maynei]|uniref:Acyltransferase-like protein n=1 Tax=Euroglyphus maynei TaxID=6958 RepID=A0A1Y3BKZ0_EURMA|nr:Acyltransferase-like protein [Euroglyphus maynei]
MFTQPELEWASLMFDASGRIVRPGFMSGTITDYGDYDQCMAIDYHDIGSDERIQARYCLMTIRLPIPPANKRIDFKHTRYENGWPSKWWNDPRYRFYYRIVSALCLPSNCQRNEIEQVARKIFKDFEFIIEVEACQTRVEQESVALDFAQRFSIGLISLHTAMKNRQQFLQSVPYWKYILLRWLRFAPPLLGMFCYQFLWPLLGTGPMMHWDYLRYGHEPCYQRWWANFLFISNWFKLTDQCGSHTWFLSADFQINLVAYFFIWLYAYEYKTGLIANVAALTVAIVCPTFIHWYYGVPLHIRRILWWMAVILVLIIPFSTYPFIQMEQIPESSFIAILYTGIKRFFWIFAIGWIVYASCSETDKSMCLFAIQ